MISDKDNEYLDLLKYYLFPILPLNVDNYNSISWKGKRFNPNGPLFEFVDLSYAKYFCVKSIYNSKIYIKIKIDSDVAVDLPKLVALHASKDLKSFKDSESDIDLIESTLKYSINKSVCSFLSKYDIVKHSIKLLKSLSNVTYEGKRISKIIGFTSTPGYEIGNYEDFLKSKYSYPLASSNDSAILVNIENGTICKYVVPSKKYEGIIASENLEDICGELIKNGASLILILTSNGEIQILKDKRLIFILSNEVWHYVRFNNFKSALFPFIGDNSSIYEKIFNLLLDVSQKRTGGCFAIINDEKEDQIISLLKTEDIFTSCSDLVDGKRKVISSLIEYRNREKDRINFINLNRTIQGELLSLDGATIISKKGILIATGAILKKINPEKGGGRTAAAIELSKYGASCKVSEDGLITLYVNGKIKFSF